MFTYSKYHYITCGDGPKIYLITFIKTRDNTYEVAVYACDLFGCPQENHIIKESFSCWLKGYKFFRFKIREYNKIVNGR